VVDCFSRGIGIFDSRLWGKKAGVMFSFDAIVSMSHSSSAACVI
jgi:hypothetical protein